MIFILICALFGGVIGFGAAVLTDKMEEQSYTALLDENGKETGVYTDEDGYTYIKLIDIYGESYMCDEEQCRSYILDESIAYTHEEDEKGSDNGVMRDEAGTAFICCTDTAGNVYAVPFVDYYFNADSYDYILDYDTEYEIYLAEFRNYDDSEDIDEYAESDETWYFSDDGLVIINEDGTENAYAVSELAGGAAFVISLAVILFGAFNADKRGGKIFMMADVNLLFSSPLKPQSVLLFRIITKLGSILALMLFYSLCYMHSIISIFSLTPFGVVLLFLSIFCLIGYGSLVQVLCYTITATDRRYAKVFKYGLYAMIIAVLGIFTVYWRGSGLAPLPAAISLFCRKSLSWIPVAGWMKGLITCLIAKDTSGLVIWYGIVLAGMALLGTSIWRIKADFYEDAMNRSEEVAEVQRAVQEKGSIFSFSKKKKEDSAEKPSRAEKTKDGFSKGQGASMFFRKAMHIRYRFAFLHYFTKSADTYLFTAAAACIFGKFMIHSDLFMPCTLMLGILCFYRSLSNPLGEDMNSDLFRLIPESTAAKLFWSLAGGIANCILDLVPALLVLAAVFRPEPLTVLAAALLIISVYAYALVVGAFMEVAIPINAGENIKQIIQIMFIYFGLLPDILVIAAGYVMDMLPLFCAAAFLLNLAVSAIFLMLSADFLEPKEGTMAVVSGSSGAVKTIFSGIGWALVIIYAAGSAAQLLASYAAVIFSLSSTSAVVTYLLTFLPLYLIGFPLGIMKIRKLPAVQEETKYESFTFLRLVKCFVIGAGTAYAASTLGSLFMSVFESSTQSALEELITVDTIIMQGIFLVICAPVLEEYVFRKLIIDHTRALGEKQAVIISALMFGLFHGNLQQFLYASVFGLTLGYVYLKTGKLRYTIAMHMLFNFNGSIVSGAVSRMENTNVLIPALYSYFIIGLIILGIILLLFSRKKITFKTPERKSSLKAVWINSGMLCFTLIMGLSILVTFITAVI